MNELGEISGFLAALPPFDTLDEAALARAARAVEVAYFRGDAEIIAAGTDNDRLFVVRSGAVELRDADGNLSLRVAEGEYFGFPALMRQQPARRRAAAIEDTLVYALDGDAFRALRQASPDFDTFFIRALSDRLLQSAEAPSFGHELAVAVGDLVKRPAVTIGDGASIRETAQRMVEARVSAMLVTDDGGAVTGIVTDRDIRSRVVAAGRDASGPVAGIMTASPITLDTRAHAFEAALTMMQHHIHHVPVTRDGAPIGMVTRSDFMRLETEHPLYLVGDLGRQSSPEGLVAVCERLPSVIAQQVEAGATGEQLGRFITTVTDTVTRQLIRIAESELGTAPCDYAWVALGSQGRCEQSAKSDQDNALVLAEPVDDEGDAWFAAMAKVVNDGLDACGWVYCPGDVMAGNPKWRQPIAQWHEYFRGWITVPEQKALMHANIFFDLRAVAGNAALVDRLKDGIRDTARGNELFLALMAKNAMTWQPPLGLFRQFVVERGGEHNHELDLKHRGIMPIVEIARIRSLAAGQVRIGTRNRLRAAAEAGELTQGDAGNLIDALDFIEQLRLADQSEQMRRGEAPDNHVDPADLSRLHRQNLKAAFSQVRTSQQALLNRFHIA